MEASLLVDVLSRESQRKLESTQPTGVLIRQAVAEWLPLVPAPHGLPRLVGNEARCVEMIDVDDVRYLAVARYSTSNWSICC